MFETPVDTLFYWVALAGVSLAVFGVVTAMPATAPPDAAATAATIDEVTTSPPGSVVHRPTTAVEWRLEERQLGLRNDGGASHATLTRPVVPVHGDRLGRVLGGENPRSVYGSADAFERAVASARTRTGAWRPAPDRLTIRRVAWGEVDVTLVG